MDLKTKEIIVLAFGTYGDVYPFIGIAKELKNRGFNVSFLSNEFYREAVETHGIVFIATGNFAEYQRGMKNKKSIKSIAAYRKIVGKYTKSPMIMPEYDYVYKKNQTNPNILLLIQSYENGGYLAAEKYGIPFVRIMLSPYYLDAPIPPTGFYQKLRSFFNGKPLTEPYRSRLGLPSSCTEEFSYKQSCIDIGMFPDWFSHRQDSGVMVGFPLFDVITSPNNTIQLEKFITEFGAPFVFFMGTGINSEKRFFIESLKLCEAFGCSGIFVTNNHDSIPKKLPRNIHVAPFIDFKTILPKCKLLVHSGGIGTTARAMEAGIPQLVCPRFAGNDQSYNGQRAMLFGSAGYIPPSHYDVENTFNIIQVLIHKSKLKAMRIEIAEDLLSNDSIGKCCNLIETTYQSYACNPSAVA